MSSGVLFDAPGPKARRRHAVLTVLGALVLLGLLWLVYRRLDDKGQLTSAMWKPPWRTLSVQNTKGTLRDACKNLRQAYWMLRPPLKVGMHRRRLKCRGRHPERCRPHTSYERA